MPKRIEKVMTEKGNRNKCPLCGEACTTSSWNKYKKCTICQQMLDKGISPEQVERIRANELNDEVMNDETDISELFSKRHLYDFKKTFPAGLRIVTRDKKEAKFLQEVYSYYAHYGDNVPEFNVLIGGLLQSKLEEYRNSELLSNADLPYNERKGIEDISNKIIDQINKTTKVLKDLKSDMNAESGNILTTKFASMLTYLAEHEQEYMGVGLCSECNNRVIFKTNFPTFKATYTEIMHEVAEIMLKSNNFDTLTIKTFTDKMTSELNGDALLDTYVVEHVRQLEAELV